MISWQQVDLRTFLLPSELVIKGEQESVEVGSWGTPTKTNSSGVLHSSLQEEETLEISHLDFSTGGGKGKPTVTEFWRTKNIQCAPYMRHTTLVSHLIFWGLCDFAYIIDSKTHVFFPLPLTSLRLRAP